ncbi:sensor histidine kinase [Streptomyces hoynatensis]|uniref:histidine kinase n=1 Tax=Streptomyces hoynatensis TaxID=1141874 RepID=A0A3A9Z0A6_9ACTN|nr:sensor histidine kinase [Streptomyces hoynatensis]RKN41781.1 histidine kinase [Streptomyces hoynatensis]
MSESVAAGDRWEHRLLLPGELLTDGAASARRRAARTGRDWLVDVLFFAAALGVWALFTLTSQDREQLPGWLLAVDPPLGALACLALWWRRRFPLLLALAAVPVGAVSDSCFGALSILLLNLGLRVPWRPALAALGLHLAACAPYALLYLVPEDGGWAPVAFVLAYYLLLFAWGTGVRVRRELVLRLREDARRERAEHARRLAEARRAERVAIAREMHDVLAHRISLLSVHAGALAYRTGRTAAEGTRPLTEAEISESAQTIRDTAHQALEELREVLTLLRGRPPGDGGREPAAPGISALPDLLAEAESAGQRVTLTESCAGDPGAALRGPAQRTVYRVVQEGLTNARKHAPGLPVAVRLDGGPGEGLTVRLRNALAAGPARAEIPGAGAGLAGLEERVALDGGSLSHGPTADGCFELTATLPWPAAGPAAERTPDATGAADTTGAADLLSSAAEPPLPEPPLPEPPLPQPPLPEPRGPR